MANLLDVPDLAMRNVFKKLDMDSVFTLRKVNQGLRTFVDEEKPDFPIRSLEIIVENETAYLILSIGRREPKRITYFGGQKRRALVSENEKDRPVKAHFLKALCIDLDIILKNQKSILEKIIVNFRCDVCVARMDTKRREKELEKDTKKFLGYLTDIFKSREAPIKAKELEMTVMNHEQILAVLPYLCPETLRSLRLKRAQQRLQVLDISEILKLKQWNSISGLRIAGFHPLTESAMNFDHFPYCDTGVETISVEDMLYLKECYIKIATITDCSISYQNFVGKERLVEVFGPVTTEDRDRKNWEYDIPEEKRKMRMTFGRRGFIKFELVR